HAELHAGDFLRSDLEGDVFRVIDEDTVAPVGQVEGNILVRLLAARAAVFVPHLDHLPVLHEGGKAFAEAVHALAHAEAELLMHVGAFPRHLDVAHPARPAPGDDAIPGAEFDAPTLSPGDANR